ncbi:DUF6932 family protein [Aeromonas veronii]|uniref:DUF6932 family protein n=1 Tax=Aeromonas veronii TaxID=654 RepID=UPI00142F8AA2|nr:hypothetical protein [Aeromonas veronii]NJI19889.1 hypothetical protein [Aeromonas veronii]
MTNVAHTPLHPLGFKDLQLVEIYDFFVAPFAGSNRRQPLATNLTLYIQQLAAILTPNNVRFEVWIDGSFCTDKMEPNDVDVLVSCSGADLNGLPVAAQQNLSVLVNNNFTKTNFNIDAYFCPSDDVNNRSYWRGWFLFDRNENPKGVARINL